MERKERRDGSRWMKTELPLSHGMVRQKSSQLVPILWAAINGI